ncbi:hypothetical protein [Microbacterium album]|uniref:Uncharacterized protein n=1 Tax=Microbacterium album TaxID=2053191 RepID=A0A917MKC2_9MICO|nr:hypothetical protein [Microbacterium album]GGH33977.1 hypothetical protein GCM10010921_01330 [Microbacterium album]
MNEFKASNGVAVRLVSAGLEAQVDNGIGVIHLALDRTAALREFFLHERDEQLGRWRWPENPDYVVYPREERRVRVIHEPTGDFADSVRGTTIPGPVKDAARAYFDAHPEPKPWRDAKPGEVWVVTKDDTEGEFAAVVSDPVVTGRTSFDAAAISFPVTDLRITAARRIWPGATS